MGSGSFNWLALASQTASESVTGLGESPYYPTLRAPRKKVSAHAHTGASVHNPEFGLSINANANSCGEGQPSYKQQQEQQQQWKPSVL